MRTPTTIAGAVKRGWIQVSVNNLDRDRKNVSHLGLCIWADRNCTKKYVGKLFFQDGSLSMFMFEDAVDAFFFKCRWT